MNTSPIISTKIRRDIPQHEPGYFAEVEFQFRDEGSDIVEVKLDANSDKFIMQLQALQKYAQSHVVKPPDVRAIWNVVELRSLFFTNRPNGTDCVLEWVNNTKLVWPYAANITFESFAADGGYCEWPANAAGEFWRLKGFEVVFWEGNVRYPVELKLENGEEFEFI